MQYEYLNGPDEESAIENQKLISDWASVIFQNSPDFLVDSMYEINFSYKRGGVDKSQHHLLQCATNQSRAMTQDGVPIKEKWVL